MTNRPVLAAFALTLAAAMPLHAQTGIRSGETVPGSLTDSDRVLSDGSYYDLYSFRGQAGDEVSIVMRSDDFDTFLVVGQESDGELDSMEIDDDGAGGTDSRIDLTLPRSGEYLIRANSLSGGATGAYRISMSSDAAASERSSTGIIEVLMDSAAVLFSNNGLSPRTDLLRRFLPEGGSAEIPVQLESSGLVAFVAVCSLECSDVDLEVLGPDGQSVGSDYLPDDAPIVTLESAPAGLYRLHVSMPACGANTCEVGAQVYGQ